MDDVIPQEMALEMGLILLLNFDERSNRMQTQYGRITHLSWLRKEKARIEQAPDRKAVIAERTKPNKSGVLTKQYALYVDRAPDYIFHDRR
jgi:hypothetical protein